MGKFFMAGLFLGGAVTWAVMHFLVSAGALKGEELDEALELAKREGGNTAKIAADKEWKAKLDGERGRLKKEHEKTAAEVTTERDTLRAANRELRIKLESALEDVGLAEERVKKYKGERDAARAAGVGKSEDTKELLVMSTKLHDLKVRVNRELGEGCTALGQGLVGWPDVKLAREVAKSVAVLSRRHRKLAQNVRVYIDQHSKGLARELTDLAPYRAGVREKDIDAIDVLAAKIASTVKTMKTDEVVVEAANEEWTDTEVFVEPGDVIQIRAEGTWRMALVFGAAGPEGWDGAAQYKLYGEARAGALILRVGISDRVHPAYLGKPIIADAKGRVKLRMNDKDVRDNGGSIKAEVVSSDPKALREIVKLWKAFKKL